MFTQFRLGAIALALGCAAIAQAETKPNVTAKFSGYIIGQYSADSKSTGHSNGFNLRLIRANVAGRAFDDFEYRLQVQANGSTSTLGESPRVVDAFIEWQKFKEMKVKVGQFKRPFTLENPMNPIDQGFGGYSQAVSKLSGFSDRDGSRASNGRDLGVQLQGDISILHYQVGVFNGQGINTKDLDNRKDIIGGLWVSPIQGLRIAAFGWAGTYARSNTAETVSLNQYRYALGAEYKKAELCLRSEYIHSTGGAFSKTENSKADQSDCTIKESLGNKADAWYAAAIVPVVKGKLRAKARYDVYRPTAEWQKASSKYECGLNWSMNKAVELQSTYGYVYDRSLAKSSYNTIDLQLSVRF